MKAIASYCLRICILLSAVMALTACGGGGSGGDAGGGAPGGGDPLTGSGVKGPLAHAVVSLYNFDGSRDNFRGLDPVVTGTTDAAAAMVGVQLPRNNRRLTLPLIVELTSDAATVDLSTGRPPVVPTLRTVITAERLAAVRGGEAVYATPLTTLAVDLAIARSGPGASAETFTSNLASAASLVKAAFGFGMSQTIDIYRAAPVLKAGATSLDAQSQVAEYRTAIEATAAVVVELRKSISKVKPNSSVNNDQILAALALDLADGVIDGARDGTAPAALRDVVGIDAVVTTDPATLKVPDTAISLSDIEQILVAEAAVTCGCSDAGAVSNYLADGSVDVQPAPVNPIVGTNPSLPKLTLLSAAAISDTSVLLKFSEALSASAEKVGNYQILKSGGGEVLAITGVVRTDLDTGVILVTAPQEDVAYRVVVRDVGAKATGVPIDSVENERTFLGMAAETAVGEPPRVVGAISQGNTKVIVTFSKPMGDSAGNELNYEITQDNVNPEVGALGIVSARLVGADRTVVELTTLSQNEVSYTVKAVNVTDLYGQQLDVQIKNSGVFIADSAAFAGTAPGGVEFVDTDGDGLSDNEEQKGWTVSIVLVDGSTVTREVTGSAFYEDTDNDGLSDREELALHTDPRDRDTDDDLLSDAYEFNAVFTDPLNQDTDGDTLSDWLETDFFRTSPLLADTDGDQINDDLEVILATRNASVADLPQPTIEILSTDLQLNVKFEETDQTATRDLESRQINTTLTQSSEKSNSRTNTTANEVTTKLTVGAEWSSGGATNIVDAAFPRVKASTSFEAGYSSNWSSSWTEESSRSTQNEYAKSLNTEAEVSEESTVSRTVESASISAAVMLGSLGDIAFNMSNIQITALVPDIRDPSVFLPVATLVPEIPAGSTIENSYTLGPLVAERGPIVFINREVFPAQVERLMKDPTGVIFKISNYNITDELGRDFAFTSQDIVDRTAPVNLDFGTVDTDGDGLGDGTETYRVATSLGVRIGDVAATLASQSGKTEAEVRTIYGLQPDDVETRVAFGLDGGALGVKFQDIMENILDLKHYDEDTVASGSLTPTEQATSYSTAFVGGIERVVRIRQTRNNEPSTPFKRWGTLTPDGLLIGGELSLSDADIAAPDDDRLLPSRGVTLAYVQDIDGDNIPARLEVMHSCRDDDKDSDNDGLSDRLEVFGPRRELTPEGIVVISDPDEQWNINIVARGSYPGFSGCRTVDSDLDGLRDYEEYMGGLFRRESTPEGDVPKRFAFAEISGATGALRGIEPSFDVRVLQDPANFRVMSEDGTSYVPLAATALPVPGDPSRATGAVLTFAEPLEAGVTYVINILDPGKHWWLKQAGGSFSRQGRTDAKAQDTDGDGLTDYQELTGYKIALFFPQVPESACTADPDPDAPENSVICTSDPLNPDSDGDTLQDGGEVALRSDPSIDDGEAVVDLDGDGLLGGEESFGWDVVSRWLVDFSVFTSETGNLLTDSGEIISSIGSPKRLAVTTRCSAAANGVTGLPGSGECYVHEEQLVSSDSFDKDTDNDGLTDLVERDLGLHPRDADSDNDGRSDFEEHFGFPKGRANQLIVVSDPLNYDSDFDEVSDGKELVAYTVGPVINKSGIRQPTYTVTTDPNGETDSDTLSDFAERSAKTDASANDTDGDGLNDASEIRAGSDPLRADQFCVAAQFTKVSQTNTDCDGLAKDNGAEITGNMLIDGIGVGQLDKNLSANVEEQISNLDSVYVLLVKDGQSVTFSSSTIRECDNKPFETPVEGKPDGEISALCKAFAAFSNVDYTLSFDDYLSGQTDFKAPKVKTKEGGELCDLEFTVSITPVTDSVVNSASEGEKFCQEQ